MRYFDNWKSYEEMVTDFLDYSDRDKPEARSAFPPDAAILFAQYGNGSYDGSCYVVYEQEGKLYTVEGSHCSCYGLEGQWSPMESSWAALAMGGREFDGYGGKLGSYDCSAEAHAAYWALVDSRQ